MKFLIFTLLSTVLFFHYSLAQNDVKEEIKKNCTLILPSLVELYKDLHQNPELSLQEKNTAHKMATELKQLGFQVTENVGGFGVVAVFKNGAGPTVLVRTEMDGLPVEEKTGLPYASKVKVKDKNGKEVSVMHACGHDVHMSVFIGTAKTLTKLKHLWKGTLLMIAQPAEEIGAGAKAMLDDGLYSKFPKPDVAIALHDNAFIPAGTVGYKKEYVMASVDRIDITVFGEGGHGASPHSTKDPIIMAAEMILAFQTIVSRETNPIEPTVLTVGAINGGNTHNIIPDEVKMQLTIRSYSDEVRRLTINSIKRISKGIAIAAGMSDSKMPLVNVDSLWTPSTYNDPILTERVKKSLISALGIENVREVPPYMVGEDFCFYGRTKEKIPTCIFWLGAVNPYLIKKSIEEKKELPSLHSPYFAPLPEKTIETGVKAMSAAIFDTFLTK